MVCVTMANVFAIQAGLDQAVKHHSAAVPHCATDVVCATTPSKHPSVKTALTAGWVLAVMLLALMVYSSPWTLVSACASLDGVARDATSLAQAMVRLSTALVFATTHQASAAVSVRFLAVLVMEQTAVAMVTATLPWLSVLATRDGLVSAAINLIALVLQTASGAVSATERQLVDLSAKIVLLAGWVPTATHPALMVRRSQWTAAFACVRQAGLELAAI